MNDLDEPYSLRPLVMAIVVSILLGLLTAFILPDSVVNSPVSHWLVAHVAIVFPAILVTAKDSFDPSRSGLTWATQWVMSMVYIVVYFYNYAPWSENYRSTLRKHCVELTRRGKSWWTPFFGAAALASIMLSDLGVLHLVSFTRGTIFSGSLHEMVPMFRAQFESRIGMTYYALLVPMITATCYWLLVSILVNVHIYRVIGDKTYAEENN